MGINPYFLLLHLLLNEGREKQASLMIILPLSSSPRTQAHLAMLEDITGYLAGWHWQRGWRGTGWIQIPGVRWCELKGCITHSPDAPSPEQPAFGCSRHTRQPKFLLKSECLSMISTIRSGYFHDLIYDLCLIFHDQLQWPLATYSKCCHSFTDKPSAYANIDLETIVAEMLLRRRHSVL